MQLRVLLSSDRQREDAVAVSLSRVWVSSSLQETDTKKASGGKATQLFFSDWGFSGEMSMQLPSTVYGLPSSSQCHHIPKQYVWGWKVSVEEIDKNTDGGECRT